MSFVYIPKKSLYDILKEAGKPMPVHDLFERSGFTHESVMEFYEEMYQAIHQDKVIRSQRCKDTNEVFLDVIS